MHFFSGMKLYLESRKYPLLPFLHSCKPVSSVFGTDLDYITEICKRYSEGMVVVDEVLNLVMVDFRCQIAS